MAAKKKSTSGFTPAQGAAFAKNVAQAYAEKPTLLRKPKAKKKKPKGHPWKGAAPAAKEQPSLADIEQQEIKKASREKVPANPHLKNGIQQNVKVDGSESFTVHLQGRHAEWLHRVARSEARSPESMIERIIRAGYATDPSKGGLHEAAPGTSFPAEDIGKI